MKKFTFTSFKEAIRQHTNTFVNEYCPFDTPVSYSYYRKENKEKGEKLAKEGWIGYVTSINGVEGGNCWGGEANQPFSNPVSPNPKPLSLICRITCPEITFLQYEELEYNLQKHEFELLQREYYGNSTTYNGYYYMLSDVFDTMIELKLIEENEKEAILIGGLPCSGKTTLAKEEYSNYKLIDDPRDWEKDVLGKIKKQKRVVITDPYLSFKKNRKRAKEMLEEHGFTVSEVVLNVHKKTLYKRAKELGKEDRIEFIKRFKVEK